MTKQIVAFFAIWRTRLKMERNIQKAEGSVGLIIRSFMNCNLRHTTYGWLGPRLWDERNYRHSTSYALNV